MRKLVLLFAAAAVATILWGALPTDLPWTQAGGLDPLGMMSRAGDTVAGEAYDAN